MTSLKGYAYNLILHSIPILTSGDNMTIAQLLQISRITKIAEEHSVPSLSLNKGGNAMLRRVRSSALKIAVATAVGFGCIAAPAGAQTQAATFKVAADVGLVPFFIRSPTGGVE